LYPEHFFGAAILSIGFFERYSPLQHEITRWLGWTLGSGLLDIFYRKLPALYPGVTMAILPLYWVLAPVQRLFGSGFASILRFMARQMGLAIINGNRIMSLAVLVLAVPAFGIAIS